MSSQEQETAPDLSELVRDAFVEADPDPGRVTDAAAQAVYGYLVRALEDESDPPGLVRSAVSGVIAGAKKRTAPFWHAARGALVGVVHAGLGQRLELEPLIDAATVAAMDGAHGVGGDFAAVAQGAVEGCITAADELGLDDEALGSRAATAALERARELHEGAFEKVHGLVTRHVMGVPITVPAHLREV